MKSILLTIVTCFTSIFGNIKPVETKASINEFETTKKYDLKLTATYADTIQANNEPIFEFENQNIIEIYEIKINGTKLDNNNIWNVENDQPITDSVFDCSELNYSIDNTGLNLKIGAVPYDNIPENMYLNTAGYVSEINIIFIPIINNLEYQDANLYEFTNEITNPQPSIDTQYVYDVIPITEMMLTILAMPFNFIKTAFNVTLWEGTPYQLNFSNLFLVFIAILALIFIIKLFTSGFSVIGNYTKSNNDNLTNKKPEKKKPESDKKE